MSNVNNLAVSGNLVADPVLKKISDDFSVCELRIANNRSKKTEAGYEDATSYFDVTVFGKYGELVDGKARKGDAVTVTGRLEQQRWEKDGESRSKVVIIADNLDGACFYKKADQIAAKTADGGSNTPATAASSTPAPADDDIPF